MEVFKKQMKKILPFAVIASAAMLLTACTLFQKEQNLNVNSKEEAQAYLIQAVEDTTKEGAKLTADARATIDYGEIDADIRATAKLLIGKNYEKNYGKLDLGINATYPVEVEDEEEPEGEGQEDEQPAGEGETEGGEPTTIVEPETEMTTINDTITLEGYAFKNKLLPIPQPTGLEGEGDSSELDGSSLTPIELKQTYSVYGKLYDRHAALNTIIPILFPLEEGEDHVEYRFYEPDEEIDLDLHEEPEEGKEPTLPTSYSVKGAELTLEYNLPLDDDIILPVKVTVKNGTINATVKETTINYAGDEDDLVEGEATLKVSLNAELKKGGQEELELLTKAFKEEDWLPEEEPETPPEEGDGQTMPLV